MGTPRRTRLQRFWRWARIGGLVLLGVVGVSAALGAWRVWSAWPRTEGTRTLSGLHGEVEIVRDASGVPHIYAGDDHDLLFAQGFVHAQDRLWSMDFDRRLASGRLSELVGPSALDFDKFLRTLGSLRTAERDLAALEEETRELLRAYCAGVNAFIEDHRNRLPVEYTLFRAEPAPWEPVDVLVRGKLMGWLLAENSQFEISRARMVARLEREQVQDLLPPYRDGAPLVVPPRADEYAWLEHADLSRTSPLDDLYGAPTSNWGSNQWSIAGHRTATGSALLANDTHLQMAMPSVWYHVGLHGGSFDVVGAGLPGVPLVLLGHNGRIAWGVTDMLPDVQDYYIERFDDPEDPRRYRFRGEWHDLEIVREMIPVRGREPVDYAVWWTRHGPIMNRVMGRLEDFPRPLALRWAEHEPNRLLDAVVALNRATDWQSFRRALSRWDGPHMNFGYADAEGHVGYQSTGKVPIRVPGHQGLVPVPGWTGEHEWQGFIPFEELPRVFDPPSGTVVTANNKVVGPEYPYHLAHEWSDPYRAMRIAELLDGGEDFTVADMERFQLDSLSIHARELRPVLLATEPETEAERRALELVAEWDLRQDASSPAASVFQTWYRALLAESVGDELGDELFREYRRYYWVHGPMMEDLAARPEDPWFDDVGTDDRAETLPEISARALRRAVAWLSENHGSRRDGWAWGELHPAIFGHRPLGASGVPFLERLFNGAAVPASGDRFTINATWFGFDEGRPYSAVGGAGQRLVVDLADPDASRFVQNSGQSEHLFHPHRMDLVPLWQDGAYRSLLYTRRAVEEAAVQVLRLVPAGPGGATKTRRPEGEGGRS